MGETIVELKGVSKRFGRIEALKDLDFRLEAGASYGLIGRNGAGKTTLLRLVLGMLRPTEGEVRVFGGDPIEEAEKVKAHIGYLAEDQSYPASLRPVDLFRFFASCYPTWDPAFLEALVRRFRIPVGRTLGKLSKGQARQVGLLCALSHRPRLLVLDEPGGGLDPVVRRRFLEEVIELLASEKTAVLFSSHNLQEVERLASRIGILHGGRLLLEGDLDRLREGSCQLLVEGAGLDGLEAEDLKARLPGCLQARRRDGAWAVTVLAGEEEARERLRALPGARVREARPLSLEDLFVALAGDEP
ncbi:MAG: ABC transporter ATP-binding protein [Planctomycetes bacterium]|nr:ABC transporter ATP-binding protein [Planctomycetota bacterium]